MYRQYEDPRELEKERDRLKEQMKTTTDEDERFSLHETLMELEDRINFAWQDEEYDMKG